jgi:FAD-dependent urate hydroxylase
MAFWDKQMPAGMYLRSHPLASSIADPKQELTLDAYCRQNSSPVPKPVPLKSFVDYGRWYQRHAVPNVEKRHVLGVEPDPRGFKVVLADGEEFISKRVVVATGISTFAVRPEVFDEISPELASHTSEHNDLLKFKGQRVVVIGAGQSALESAALFKEAGIQVEVIARTNTLNWVGLHARLHHLGLISKILYSTRDVGPAGISRLVALPHLFRKFPRGFQDRVAYRAIRPAGAGWLKPRYSLQQSALAEA